MLSFWFFISSNRTRRREKSDWIFGINTNFNSMAIERQIFLLEFKSFTGSDVNLQLHNVLLTHFFCYGMLHLNSRIHFQKVKILLIIHQKFNRRSEEHTSELQSRF